MTEPVTTHRPDASGLRGTFDLELGPKHAGFLSYSLEGDTMYVNYVEVDPSLRGRQLGDRLVAAAVEWARTAGYKRMSVDLMFE